MTLWLPDNGILFIFVTAFATANVLLTPDQNYFEDNNFFLLFLQDREKRIDGTFVIKCAQKL